MSGRRFIPHRTVIAQRRAADNTCFIVLGLTITVLFIGSLTRLVWKNSAKVIGSRAGMRVSLSWTGLSRTSVFPPSADICVICGNSCN